MAEYRISGVWKDSNNVITHYGMHKVGEKSTSRAEKTSKADAITITESRNNKVYTWVWNYKTAFWKIGEEVHVVNGSHGKYLRSDPDDEITDNLGQLIDYDWVKFK